MCFWTRLKEPVAGGQQPLANPRISLSAISSGCDTFQATFRCRRPLTQDLAANRAQYFENASIQQAQPNLLFVQTAALRGNNHSNDANHIQESRKVPQNGSPTYSEPFVSLF